MSNALPVFAAATCHSNEVVQYAIYKRYGYWTSVGSAIATWAVIANMN
jgi:hypothetical protein